MGDSLIVRAGSVLVEFADGSDLAIEPDSRVLFNKLTVFGPAGMVDTHLRFAYGRATSVGAAAEPRRPLSHRNAGRDRGGAGHETSG